MTDLVVVVEEGRRRTFASALDWPGWSRAGSRGQPALEALVASAPRYAEVVRKASLAWPGSTPGDWQVVVAERVPGGAGTDFGVPEAIVSADRAPVGAADAQRLTTLMAGAWAVLDEVVAASPAQLRKGPRGGGRDRDPMLAHVLGAEAAYARKLGLSPREPAIDDRAGIEALRAAILDIIRSGQPVAHPRRTLWPVRYAARRIAWHVLDHAWEMQDRSG